MHTHIHTYTNIQTSICTYKHINKSISYLHKESSLRDQTRIVFGRGGGGGGGRQMGWGWGCVG